MGSRFKHWRDKPKDNLRLLAKKMGVRYEKGSLDNLITEIHPIRQNLSGMSEDDAESTGKDVSRN